MPNGVMDPEAKAENVYPGRAGKPSNPAQHEKCMKRLRRAIESSEFESSNVHYNAGMCLQVLT